MVCWSKLEFLVFYELVFCLYLFKIEYIRLFFFYIDVLVNDDGLIKDVFKEILIVVIEEILIEFVKEIYS